MPDWTCSKCGGESGDHADPKSPSFSCIWEPIDTDWLAEHVRQACEKAFEEGRDAGKSRLVGNPYRQASIGTGRSDHA